MHRTTWLSLVTSVLLATLLPEICVAGDSHWHGLDPTSLELQSQVWDLCVVDEQMTACGPISADRTHFASRWDGTTWQPLSSQNGWLYGPIGSAYALFWDNGILFEGGVNVENGTGIGQLDLGSSWSWPVAGGVGGLIWDFIEYNGQLIAGGEFDSGWPPLPGVVLNGIGSVDASGNWSSLGSGMDFNVHALAIYNGELVAAGTFSTAGGVAANYLAKWDGSAWSPLGSGTDAFVYALTVHDGKLYAGGDFWTAGGQPANKVAAWDGVAWSGLGSGLNGQVFALQSYAGKLIAGGGFTQAGGSAANRIAFWDGSDWHPMGSGVDGTVHALDTLGDSLYVGGSFLNAGSSVAKFVAAFERGGFEPGSSLGTNSVQPGNIVSVPIYVSTNDTLSGFTIPLQYYTTQPDNFYLDSVSLDNSLSADVILLPDSQQVIVYRDVQEPPMLDSSCMVGIMWFTADEFADDEIVLIDTTTITYLGDDYTYQFVLKSGDTTVPWFSPGKVIIGDPDCCLLRGDMDSDGSVNISDMTYLVGFLFSSGLGPVCEAHADVNADGSTNITDMTYLVAYLFSGGSGPMPCGTP